MNIKLKLTLAMLAGIAIGATAIQGLNAQSTPPAYVIFEVEVTNPEGYQTYLDRHTPIVQSAGGRFLTRGEKLAALDGPAPKRFGIIQFDSMAKALAYREAYKVLIPIRDSSSKYRSFLAEGTVSGTLGK
jgi:uncharacterized protein (DUF1330 family)